MRGTAMKKMKKMIGFGLALAAVSLTACGGKKEAETIRIGVVCPRTGESSLFGDVLARPYLEIPIRL